MKLEKYSMGIGDRFGHQGTAQLSALVAAQNAGVEITPVWNKSNREHALIGTEPADTRRAAETAVRDAGWHTPFRIDADHIGLANVGRFIPYSDFFTLDVADFIGKSATEAEIGIFLDSMAAYSGELRIPGITAPMTVTPQALQTIARKYLYAVKEAGKTFKHIAEKKGNDDFIVEVSMDETDLPQTPVELFFILAAIASEKIPAQTIAPKFSGKFLKGIDYVGDAAAFAKEFEEDVLVIAEAVRIFTLPANLKLSIHSGSDKFSLYPLIHSIIKKHDAGVHLKTAGTTWLEELIGLAEAGGDGLSIAKEIYAVSLTRKNELLQPYSSVVEIDHAKLPPAEAVNNWTPEQFASALRHDQKNPEYNLHFRQMLHVSFKVAGEMGPRYLEALKNHQQSISKNVRENFLHRHIDSLFLGKKIG